MKLPSKRFLLLSVVASCLGGAALAAYEINNLHRAITVAQKVAAAVVSGLDGDGAPTQTTATVSISLCFGLIPIGRVDNPYLVLAVGDVILGTLLTGFAIALVYMLLAVFHRILPADKSDGDSRTT